MSIKSPLVLIDGRRSELPVGSSLPLPYLAPMEQYSYKLNYSGSVIQSVEIYTGMTQTAGNLRAKNTLTYIGNDLTNEDIEVYDSDGATVLKTIAIDHSYAGGLLTKTEVIA